MYEEMRDGIKKRRFVDVFHFFAFMLNQRGNYLGCGGGKTPPPPFPSFSAAFGFPLRSAFLAALHLRSDLLQHLV